MAKLLSIEYNLGVRKTYNTHEKQKFASQWKRTLHDKSTMYYTDSTQYLYDKF